MITVEAMAYMVADGLAQRFRSAEGACSGATTAAGASVPAASAVS